MGVQIASWDSDFIPFHSLGIYIYPEVNYWTTWYHGCLNFLGTSIVFSIVDVPVYIPINSAEIFPLLHILASTYYFKSF